MPGDALQVTELVNAEAEREAYLGIEALLLTARVVLDQVVELELIAQATENEFVYQTGIARVERGGPGQQKIGSVAPSPGIEENVKSNAAGGGYQTNPSASFWGKWGQPPACGGVSARLRILITLGGR
jgi:hypothetical protein